MSYIEAQVVYHLVNILIIFALALFYTMIKSKKSAPTLASEASEASEAPKTEVLKKKQFSYKEVMKNFSAGIFIYLIYVGYNALKP